MNFYTLFNLNKIVINIGGRVKSVKYYLFNRSYYTAVKRNSTLHEKRKSDVCYVCGLGPSLRQVDLSKIDGDTIVVNGFFKIGKEYPNFIPTFYLIIDALSKKEENIPIVMEAIDEYCDKETSYLFHPILAELLNNSPSKEKFFYLSCFNGLFNSKKEFRLDQVMPAFGNVACTAIACAMALGYKKIVLLGCDFNSFASRTLDHCYGTADRKLKMSYELYCYSLVADMHDQLQTYAKSHGITIINSTKGSLIDAYPYEIDENLYKK